jgi:hypothetical protein
VLQEYAGCRRKIEKAKSRNYIPYKATSIVKGELIYTMCVRERDNVYSTCGGRGHTRTMVKRNSGVNSSHRVMSI